MDKVWMGKSQGRGKKGKNNKKYMDGEEPGEEGKNEKNNKKYIEGEEEEEIFKMGIK